MKFWDIIGLANWLLYISLKLVAKALAPIAAAFVDRRNHPVWGIEDWHEDEVPYSEAANPFGNAAHNFATRDAVRYREYPRNLADPTLEKEEGFQWRFRRSESGNYLSFRCTWGAPRSDKGKNEIYAGWTMDNSRSTFRPTLQARPAWILLVPVVVIWLLCR